MSKYRIIGALVAAMLAALAFTAAPALAWHGELSCTEFNLVGTPVDLAWSQNGQQYAKQTVTGNWEQTVPVPTPPGYGPVTVTGTWKSSRYEHTNSYTYTTNVPCGVQPQPSPSPTPEQPTTPTTPEQPTTPVSNPKPPAPKPAPKACPIKLKSSDLHLWWTPKHNKSGARYFHYNVTGKAKLVSLKLKIRTHIAYGNFHYDHSKTYKLQGRHGVLKLMLWDTHAWGKYLQGGHKLTLIAKGLPGCGTNTKSETKGMYNPDPQPNTPKLPPDVAAHYFNLK